MKFNKILPPYKFKEYWSKYPLGQTIYQAILDWAEMFNELIIDHNVMSDQWDGFQSQIDGKANSVHTHVKADITDFAHTHVKADITDFAHTHVKADITDFAHTHPINEVVNLQTALNGKANTTTTVNSKALSTNITINASDVPNTPAGNISATNVQTAINELDTEKVDKLFATNLVTNGDFSSGITGWTFSSGVSISHVSGTMQVSATNSTGSTTFPNVNTTVGNMLNQIMYVCATISELVRTNNPTIFFQLGANGSGNASNHITQNGFFSFRALVPNSTPIFFINSAVPSGASYSYRIDNVLVINLTALFGAGNEPTKEQMDALLSVYPNSWFNGSSEIGSIQAIMRALAGTQVVTPTLLNSRTGTAQYVFSKDGLVIFRGTASGGSLNTNIFVLPENIRPTATRTFPISANNAFGVITVAANGEVRQTVGALTNVFLDGIAFKVGM